MAAQDTKNMAQVASKTPSLEYREIDIPKPGPGQVVVKVSHVAQNPTDVQSFDSGAFGDGAIYGCDFVGTVVERGPGATRHEIGDTIAALIWGGEIKGLGGYAQYTLADEKISFKLPQSISPTSASTIPLALTTAWLALFSQGCLNINPTEHKPTVLIWGGSSSVGQYAIQLATLHSLSVVTTSSPRNFSLVKQLGATHVLDYTSATVVDEIHRLAPEITHIFDTIGTLDSSTLSAQASSSNATLCTVRPGKANTENVPSSVTVTDVLVWTAFLKDHAFGEFKWPASQADHELSAELYEKVPGWIEQGKVAPNQVHLLRGLEAVPEGFQMYRDQAYSAKKIVYEI